MLVSITLEGILEVTPESSLEGYALGVWARDNLKEGGNLFLNIYEDPEEMGEGETQ